jgi:hypothetical protein
LINNRKSESIRFEPPAEVDCGVFLAAQRPASYPQ